MSERSHGVVKWFNAAKGFGFIKGEGEKDIFIHQTQIKMPGYRTLEEGQEVTFEIGDGPDGRKQANNLNVVTKQANS